MVQEEGHLPEENRRDPDGAAAAALIALARLLGRSAARHDIAASCREENRSNGEED